MAVGGQWSLLYSALRLSHRQLLSDRLVQATASPGAGFMLVYTQIFIDIYSSCRLL